MIEENQQFEKVQVSQPVSQQGRFSVFWVDIRANAAAETIASKSIEFHCAITPQMHCIKASSTSDYLCKLFCVMSSLGNMPLFSSEHRERVIRYSWGPPATQHRLHSPALWVIRFQQQRQWRHSIWAQQDGAAEPDRRRSSTQCGTRGAQEELQTANTRAEINVEGDSKEEADREREE